LGYIEASLEIASQIKDIGADFAYVLTASGSRGTHAGLAAGLYTAGDIELIGMSVSRKADEQTFKVASLIYGMSIFCQDTVSLIRSVWRQ
jgi:D-cysteine desulfhydrase